MFPLKFPSALVALFLVASMRPETNVTIDDTESRIVYHPPIVWSYQGNTASTQDRGDKTTHYTSSIGATASLTFTGAVYVHFVGYAIKELNPALIPITLQPWHGSPIIVQSDAYRPPDAQMQTIIFTSNKLNPLEIYTITVTKSNATLDYGVNIDSFILTQPGGARSTSPLPGSAPAIDPPLPPFEALTTVSGGPTLTATSIKNSSVAQSSSIANADSSTPSNMGMMVGAIVGGVIRGIAIGVIIAFLAFRWRSRARSGAVPTSLYTSRPAYFGATPPYTPGHTDAPLQTTIPAVTDHHSVPSRLVGACLLLTPANIAPEQSSVNERTEMTQVQQTVPSTARIQAKTRYMGNSGATNSVSAPQPPAHDIPPLPEDTERGEAILPAYS